MKLNERYLYVIFSFNLVCGAACSTAPITTTTNSNLNIAIVVNANAASTMAANTTVTTPAASASPLAATTGSPSAIISAYYQSRVRKDEKGFRQALSKATLTEFSANAQADGEKTLVGWLNGYSSPPKQPYETRNERIAGDTALIEIKDSDTGLWSLTKLVRENGEWKRDLTSATTNSLLKQQPK